MNDAQARAVVSERSNGLCEVRFEKPGVCRGVAESKHHRRKRSQGGPDSPANMLDVCGHGTIGCHGYIEANPATARRYGLWLFAGQLPLETPARMYFRGLTGWYLLDDLGSVTWLSKRALDLAQR